MWARDFITTISQREAEQEMIRQSFDKIMEDFNPFEKTEMEKQLSHMSF